MRLSQRSYNGKVFRPKPQIHEEENFIVIATCWGSGDLTAKVMDEVIKYVAAASGDVEVTSPFERMTYLTDQANHLRIACLLANDLVIRGENRAEYISGYEVTAILYGHRQLSWAQVGGPSLLLKKDQQSLIPLVAARDASIENPFMPPLPVELLGIDTMCNVSSGDILLQPEDQLILAAAGSLPSALWTESRLKKFNLENVTQWIAQENPDAPFWLGLLDF